MNTLTDYQMMLLQMTDATPVCQGNILGIKVLKSRACNRGDAFVIDMSGKGMQMAFGPPLGCAVTEEEQEIGRGLSDIS